MKLNELVELLTTASGDDLDFDVEFVSDEDDVDLEINDLVCATSMMKDTKSIKIFLEKAD